MHTVDLLDQAIDLGKSLGFKIRQEWLGGAGGGGCYIRGEAWIFVDLALNPVEQFAQVAEALQNDPRIKTAEISPLLRRALQINAAA